MNSRAGVALLFPVLALGGAAELNAQEPMLPPPPLPGELSMSGRAWLGIGFTVRQTRRGDRPELVVRGIEAESPAAEAGLQPGDVLVALNDLPLSRDLLASVVRSIEPGDPVRLRVRRDNDELDLDVTAGERPDRLRHPRFGSRSFDTDSFRHMLHRFLDAARVNIDELELPQVYLEFNDSTGNVWSDDLRFRFGARGVAGAEFAELDAPLARYFPGAQEGLLVLNVARDTPAARAGLEAGDVVARVNQRPVRTIRELRDAIEEADEGPVTLQLLRNGQILELDLPRTRR